MRPFAISRPLGVALIVGVGLIVGAIAVVMQSSAQAQLSTDFMLSIEDGSLPPDGGTSEIIVAMSPGESAIAAVGATVSYDATAIMPTECVALVGLGACSTTTAGQINVQTVDPAGWAVPTDLFRITFTSVALGDPAALTVAVTEAYDAGGALIAGEVDNGTIVLAVNGDVNCDNQISIGDALMIAQFSVGTRTSGTCPLGDPRTQIDLTYADATRDGAINIGDALRVAQCSVGVRDCQQ